jgi:MFS family permease
MEVSDQPAVGQAEPRPRPGLGTFKSLRHRNFRLLWFGLLFSSAGQWIQQVTLGWLVYELTDSAALLGIVNGLRAVPFLLTGPLAGVLADRLDRRQLMFWTQVFLLVWSFLFGLDIALGYLQVWHIFVFTLLTGVAWSFNQPVRQSVVPEVVPREDLANAIALNSAGFNITRVVGPGLGGLLIALVGVAGNFFVQSAAYVGVAAMTYQLKLPPIKGRLKENSIFRDLKEGIGFVLSHIQLRNQMLMGLIPTVLALPYISIMPVFASDVLGVGPEGLGLLMSAPGVGAVVGTLLIASSPRLQSRPAILYVAAICLGLSLIALALMRSVGPALLVLVLVGGFQITYMSTNNTLLQLICPDHMRGRVMSLYMLNQGLMPLGSLLAGGVAQFWGSPVAFALMGLSVILVSLAVGLPGIRKSP